ncbi:RNA-binding protein Musashi homolog Rbp6 [Eumeta japonica]|uniref:RNA-binding protein Musashi homolog Rbp6 n=1 Tax=Eumeta variegata TaxID=151549 RepID=A0A4C1YCB9_EUMVA|nr:RNA-binding protein Musashi homolog Rbp6 [Eumeta japonica]
MKSLQTPKSPSAKVKGLRSQAFDRIPRDCGRVCLIKAMTRQRWAKMVTRTKKIFVGGLSAPTTLEDVKNYFEQFGPRRRVPHRTRTFEDVKRQQEGAIVSALKVIGGRQPPLRNSPLPIMGV